MRNAFYGVCGGLKREQTKLLALNVLSIALSREVKQRKQKHKARSTYYENTSSI